MDYHLCASQPRAVALDLLAMYLLVLAGSRLRDGSATDAT